MAGKWEIGTGAAGGTSAGWDLAQPRFKRLSGECSGYLAQGETLVTPVAVGLSLVAGPVSGRAWSAEVRKHRRIGCSTQEE